MATSATAAALATIVLDPTRSVPLYRQLYDSLRSTILAGQLPPGTRLPATRVLATELGIARNTVMSAYEQLLAEGYLEGQVGSGTYVARTLPDDMLHIRAGGSPSPGSRPAAHYPSGGNAW